MKKLLLLVAALVMTIAANAQPGGQGRGPRMNPEEMAKRQVEEMKKVLNLTEQQLKDVETYYLEQAKQREKMFAERNGGPGDPAQQGGREQFEKMRQEEAAKLKAIIGEENYKIWEAKRPQRGPGGPGGAGGPGERPRR